MKLRYHNMPSIPQLAWCAQVAAASDDVDVWHGPSVETRPESFVEGIWDGDFSEHCFDGRCLMGSGGLVRNGRIVFASPWHTLENIFLVVQDTRIAVSNSLPFLLEHCGLHLDVQYPGYHHALCSIRRGIRDCIRHIPSTEGPGIEIIRHANIVIDRNLNLTRRKKAPLPDWAGFAGYRRLMSGIISRLVENASSSLRKKKYNLVTTISTGYDSTAASVLAYEAGCRRGITFSTGIEYPSNGQRVPDSGAGIGKILGLEMTEFEVEDFKIRNNETAAEFAACGDGLDLQFAAFEPQLSDAVLFTGHPGSYWGPHYPKNTQLARQDVAGISLAEFRIRTGFVHVPVPAITGPHQPQIVDLSRSAEMKPWSVGQDYDRPVPRRIVEEAGVPREMFGQVKKGSFCSICLGRFMWHPTSDFQSFCYSALRQRSVRRHAAHLAAFVSGRFFLELRRAQSRLLTGTIAPPIMTDCDLPHPGPPSVMVQWGTEVLRQKYRNATGRGFSPEHRCMSGRD